MSSDPQVTELGTADSGSRAADPFDTGFYFDRWLKDLNGEWQALPADLAGSDQDEGSEFYFGSFPGSNCEINFEGILHFDGYSYGNINSPDGTLVLTARGRIEADINVRVAVIGGWVTGNIVATDRVVLESEAKVVGQIYTPALSVRLGAIFDGECLIIPNREPDKSATGRILNDRFERDEDFAVAAG
jgi:cytoskeletal protein CcmA (bactofilin family)